MREIKALDVDTASWEGLAADRTRWRSTLNQHLKTGKEKPMNAACGYAERSKATPADQRPYTDATFVVESASPASVSSARGDAAPAEQTI